MTIDLVVTNDCLTIPGLVCLINNSKTSVFSTGTFLTMTNGNPKSVSPNDLSMVSLFLTDGDS